MIINEKGLCAAMTDAFRKKSNGYKVAMQQVDGKAPELVLSTQDWMAIIKKEHAPRKVLALIVEHLGDLPKIGQAFHVRDDNVQTEIFNMAVPEHKEIQTNVDIKRTQITYMSHIIYQREDNCIVYMIPPKLENLLDGKLLPLSLAEDGRLLQRGLASQVYIKPYVPMQGDAQALQNLAKHKWI